MYVRRLRPPFVRLDLNVARISAMNQREKVLGMGNLYIELGLPVPMDILVEAERLGLSLHDFDQPTINLTEEGDADND